MPSDYTWRLTLICPKGKHLLSLRFALRAASSMHFSTLCRCAPPSVATLQAASGYLPFGANRASPEGARAASGYFAEGETPSVAALQAAGGYLPKGQTGLAPKALGASPYGAWALGSALGIPRSPKVAASGYFPSGETPARGNASLALGVICKGY